MSARYLISLLLGLLSISCPAQTIHCGKTGIEAPYSPVSGSFTGRQVPQSPDPLVAFRWKNPVWTDSLQVYVLDPVSVKADKNENVTVKNATDIRVNGPCNLMFDFGRVSAAWFEFESADLDGEVEMSISEFNEPAVFNVGSQHPRKTASPVRHGNTWRLELNDQLYEGVRFAWIHIHSLNKPARISSVRLVCQVKPVNYEGSFACSDTLLSRIWYTGAYTVKLNLLQNYFGAILMERSDRHSWTGDAHTSQAASMVAFGNFDFVRQNLRYTSTQYNGIASYSLYWVLSLIDYYMYTGDKALLDEMLENACKKLDIAWQHYDSDPAISFYGWDERLGGFESPTTEAKNAYKMLSIQAWTAFASVLEDAGYKEPAAKYKQYVQEKIYSLRMDRNWTSHLGVHAAADAINAGFTNKEEQNRLLAEALSDRMQRLSYSPFNQYFIIQSLAEIQQYDKALATIDDCWGGQIRYGGTTFFEVFRPSWNTISAPNDAPVNNQCGYTSLTHPWSAGVTKWLSEEILGVRPTSPGFATFIIQPHLSSRVTWAKGTVPTPNGNIEVSSDLNSGEFLFTVPANTRADIAIPKAGCKINKVTLDRKRTAPAGQDGNFIYFRGIAPGEHRIKVNYSGKMSPLVDEPFMYENETFREDLVTKGNWRNKYGNQGYVLCSYDSLSDRTRLPDFIRDLKFSRNGNAHWITSTTDIRALESDTDEPGRNLGAIHTRDPQVCLQTMTIDLLSEKDRTYQLALYFVDWDKKERRSAIEVFNLETKKLIMPVYMVRDYQDGKYIVFNVDQPIRIRINQVRGDNAALSALFFDPTGEELSNRE